MYCTTFIHSRPQYWANGHDTRSSVWCHCVLCDADGGWQHFLLSHLSQNKTVSCTLHPSYMYIYKYYSTFSSITRSITSVITLLTACTHVHFTGTTIEYHRYANTI